VWIVRVYELRPELPDDARQLPRRAQVDFAFRGECDQVGPFLGPAIEFALTVCDEHGAMPHGAKAENGQQDLVLSASPRSCRIDV
jgi:hypothetical protein